MFNNLPPIQALRCFAAAARHLSISKAGDELCITQGAVSKQIKQLESLLGTALFIRTPKGLHLTDAGLQYFDSVTQSLNILANASDTLQSEPEKQQLLIDVIPSMSHIWLIPRIHSFETRFKHLQLDLISGDGEPNFNQTQADLSIRSLNSKSPARDAIELFTERLILVASPVLLEQSPIKTTEDIFRHKLLVQNTRPLMWQRFISEQNMHKDQSPLKFGIGFQHFFMSLKAAQEGLGIALIPDFLAQESLAKGALINPLQLSMPSEFSYYLLSPSYKAQLSKVQLFSQWLIEEVTR